LPTCQMLERRDETEVRNFFSRADFALMFVVVRPKNGVISKEIITVKVTNFVAL